MKFETFKNVLLVGMLIFIIALMGTFHQSLDAFEEAYRLQAERYENLLKARESMYEETVSEYEKTISELRYGGAE